MHQSTAGTRLKIARELLGLTREKFGEMTGISYLRLASIEADRARMSVDDLAAATTVFPEILYWIVFGSELIAEELEASQNPYIRMMGAKIRIEGIPK